MTSSVKQSDKTAWGVTLLVFGVIILLEKLGVSQFMPFFNFLTSTGSYFLIAGVIFLIFKKEKTLGLVLTIVGVIIHSDFFFGWLKAYRAMMLPLALIAIGLVLVLSTRNK